MIGICTKGHALPKASTRTGTAVALALCALIVSADVASATPLGTTYSVHHRVGRDPDGPGGDPHICIQPPSAPGGDDIVTFDFIDEAVRADIFGNQASISEISQVNSDGSFLLTITSRLVAGDTLFPGELTDLEGNPLTAGCFSIGESDDGAVDPMDWEGADLVLAATISMFDGEIPLIEGRDVTSFFVSPWDGRVTVPVDEALGAPIAGRTVDEIELRILIGKDASPLNDNCESSTLVDVGVTTFNNTGATTDGPSELLSCNFNGNSQVGSDIWFDHVATCTGELTVDLCESLYDTKVAVYEGCGICPPEELPLDCNDDVEFCGPSGEQSQAIIQSTQGSCYTLRVGGFLGDQGPGELNITCDPGACCMPDASCVDATTPDSCEGIGGQYFSGNLCNVFNCPDPSPDNDDCEDCIPLTNGIVAAGSTSSSDALATSSCGGGEDDGDVWHCWTADCSGIATISLCDSAFDTTLAVFDACDGEEIACNDDSCGTSTNRSRIDLNVTEGEEYLFRVAGFGGQQGNYNIVVSGCTAPTPKCCLPNGTCGNATVDFCILLGGTPLPLGAQCLGDMNGDGVDDACSSCPSATIDILASDPPSGTIDARQPHLPGDAAIRQGIGALGGANVPAQPITIVLDPPATGAAAECFSLCETADTGAPNDIASVEDLGDGSYRIILDRPITTAAVTTISYTGDGSFVEYVSSPANVNGDSASGAPDITELIDCCVNQTCEPLWGNYSCDIDNNGSPGPADITRLIDLLNGASEFEPWLSAPLPMNTTCP